MHRPGREGNTPTELRKRPPESRNGRLDAQKEDDCMTQKKKDEKPFDPAHLKPEEKLKFEIAQELGLGDKVISGGWKSLTSKESGRIGGLITKRKREMKKELLKENS